MAGATAPRVIRFDELDSTNAEARRRAEAGEEGPVWIVAARQTAGRGRRGRAWDSGTGNLAATLLMSIRKPPAEAAQLAFVAALAVADLLTTWVDAARVRLKWPNDVLIEGRKVSGVLIESGDRGDGQLWLAIGVGVNLVASPETADRPATHLGAHLRPGRGDTPSVEAALSELDATFHQRLELWERYGFKPVLDAWIARAQGLWGPCRVQLDRESLDGVADGLDADGALRLRLAGGGVRRITAGDVFFGASDAAGH